MKSCFFPLLASLLLCAGGCQKLSHAAADAPNVNEPAAVSKKDTAAPPIGGPDKSLKYGALIGTPKPQTSLTFQSNVARKLGISYLRARTLVPNTEYMGIMNMGYSILLNFCTTTEEMPPAPFVTALEQYQSDLEAILAAMSVLPEVAVIENEESNSSYYYGTAEEYLQQLAAATIVMHAYGIRVANGGITEEGLNYLVYQDYLDRGMEAEAKDFRKRENVKPKSAKTQERAAFVKTLLQAYKTMDLDYVNFHWKATSADTKSLGEVVAYLKRETGKTIMNNEIGQFDKDPDTLLAHVKQCTADQLAYIMWYSPAEKDNKKSTPLHYNDRSLTETGYAYRDYLAQK